MPRLRALYDNPGYDANVRGSDQFRVHVRYLINLRVKFGVDLDEISGPERNLKKALWGAGHIGLYPEEYQRAVDKLQRNQKSATQL
jgi:hypothetical protein